MTSERRTGASTREDVQRDGERVAIDPLAVSTGAAILTVIRRYFRARVVGLERLPAGPALLVANHNAGITMVEPFMLGLAWHERTGGQDDLHYLGHDSLFQVPVLGELLRRVGVIRASHGAAGQAFQNGRKVVVFPGGNYEAFRPYTERHRVDFKGRTGFVRLALRYRVPIVPILNVGGHETFLVLTRGAWLAKRSRFTRWIRSDAFPIFVGLPWGVGIGPLFHFPLPAKLLVEVGEPIDLGDHDPDTTDPLVLRRLSDEVRSQLQRMMDRRAAERRWPILG